jgi:hypothetical protein
MPQAVVSTARAVGGAETWQNPRDQSDPPADTKAAQHGYTPLACSVGTGVSGRSAEAMDSARSRPAVRPSTGPASPSTTTSSRSSRRSSARSFALATAHHEETR